MLTTIKLASGCILALALANAVQAEIYQSKDESGQTVFTDSPTPGATKVELPEGNIADSVEPRPQAAPAKPAAPAPATTAGEHTVVVTPHNRNDDLEDELLRRRRHELRDGELHQEHDRNGEVARPLPAARPHPGGRR